MGKKLDFFDVGEQKLLRIAGGTTRNVLARTESVYPRLRSNILVKIEKRSYDTEELAIKQMKKLSDAQEVAKEVFGKSYIPSRFIRVVERDKKYQIVTHELQNDIYPSNNQDAFDLSDPFSPAYPSYENKKTESLFKLINSNASAKQAIVIFLENLKIYYNKTDNFILDLKGEDNVVLCQKDVGYTVIINNSAIKMWKIDQFPNYYQGDGGLPWVSYLSRVVGIKPIYSY